jgi:hypothetical protein
MQEAGENRKIRTLYSSPKMVRMFKARIVKWTEHVPLMLEIRSTYKSLVEKAEGRRPYLRPCSKLKNIKRAFLEIRCEGAD